MKQKEKKGKNDKTKKETHFVSELTLRMICPVPNTLNNIFFMFCLMWNLNLKSLPLTPAVRVYNGLKCNGGKVESLPKWTYFSTNTIKLHFPPVK